MAKFPGFIFDREGRPLDDRASDLTQDDLDTSAHRSVVQAKTNALSADGVAPIALVWLLNDDATFAAIPAPMITATVDAALRGGGILVLARHPEVGSEIRDGLLEALEAARVRGVIFVDENGDGPVVRLRKPDSG